MVENNLYNQAPAETSKQNEPLIKVNFTDASLELNSDKVFQEIYQFGRKFVYENPDVCIIAGLMLGGRGLYSTAKFVRQIKNETAFFSRLSKSPTSAKPPDFGDVLKKIKYPDNSAL